VIKKILKAVIPLKARTWLRVRQHRIFGIEHEYRDMSHSQIFDKIYQDGVWGKDSDGCPTSGSGSYTTSVIEPYINAVSAWLSEVKPTVLVDLGCGDFNVGRNFLPHTERYMACDVSSVILERNKEKYEDLDNVEFLRLDVANDNLPKGDVAFIRQVLQHLSNDAIVKFTAHVNQNKPFKHLLVTEHLPRSDLFSVNVDKPSGAYTRNVLNGGVVLHEPPFSILSKSHKVLLEVPEDSGGTRAIIRTTIYSF
jgi:hypothetical protein